MSDADVVQLPEPAAHLSARVRTDWNRGYATYEVEGVGTFVLIPELERPQRKSDPYGRVLPSNRVRVYMGTGGPHTREEKRKDLPVVEGHTLAGPLTSDTRPEPGGLATGPTPAYTRWMQMPTEVSNQAGRIVTAVAVHWGQRPDVDLLKAAYARTQAPRLARRAAKRADAARRRFEQAGRDLVMALANEQHQQRLKETEGAEQAAALIGPDSPVWNEYSVYGNRHRDSGEFLVGAVIDAAGNVVDDGAGSGDWEARGQTVKAASPEEAVAEVVRQIEEGEQE